MAFSVSILVVLRGLFLLDGGDLGLPLGLDELLVLRTVEALRGLIHFRGVMSLAELLGWEWRPILVIKFAAVSERALGIWYFPPAFSFSLVENRAVRSGTCFLVQMARRARCLVSKDPSRVPKTGLLLCYLDYLLFCLFHQPVGGGYSAVSQKAWPHQNSRR